MRAIRCRILSSGHDVAAVLINSQEVWTTSQNLYKIKLTKTLS